MAEQALDIIQQRSLTPEDKANIKKKLGSRRWRLDNLYWITDEDGNEIHFKMNLVQKIIYLGLWYCSIILKARQPGVTTFFCIFLVYLLIFF